MTVQVPETLLYQGEESGMSGAPLSDYFAMGGLEPRFAPSTSMLWRGYEGRWEIIDHRLYLIGLEGKREDGTEASVATIFPDFPDRVFAHWYSGTICVPRGEILEYQFDAGVFEQDLLLDVERGVVVATRARPQPRCNASRIWSARTRSCAGPTRFCARPALFSPKRSSTAN